MKIKLLALGVLTAVVIGLPTTMYAPPTVVGPPPPPYVGEPLIAAGGGHTLAVASSGAVLATGNNSNGQLGTGSTTDSASFIATSLTQAISIDGGDVHTLAVKADGTVWAWGGNGNGRLGDGTSTQRLTPVQVLNLTNMMAVAAGGSHSLALSSNGTVWAWGLGTSGQLGNGTNLSRTTPVQVTGLNNIVAIAAGDTHSLALAANGTVWAWGNNGSGRLGDPTPGNRSSPVAVGNFNNIIAIAAGGSHSMALDASGQVWAWGLNSSGQLGNNTTTTSTNAVAVSGLSGVINLAAGNAHSAALLADGTVRTWGANASGQLGNANLVNQKMPVTVLGLNGVRAIAAGDLHSAAMLTNGTVVAWGDLALGQLGNGEFNYRPVAGPVDMITNAVGVAAGSLHNTARLADNSVMAWGNNANGQLGNGGTADTATFASVGGLTNVVALENGDLHSLALKSDGTIWAWGYNGNGRLGDGTSSQRLTPVRVTNLTEVAAVAAGGGFSLALKTNGTVWAWGLGTSGQLGNGANLSQTTRVQVSGLNNIVAIAAGDTHAMALDSTGTVWAWGNNANGRLGDGTTVNRSNPVAVVNLPSIVALAAGGSHSLALDSSGQVWAWGVNSSGQLGNNSSTSSFATPVLVTNLSGVVKIAAGNVHSLALLTNGTVRAWGGNTRGQLGIGTLVNQKTNVTVLGVSGASAIAAGDLHSVAVLTNGTVLAWGDTDNGQLGDGNAGYYSTFVSLQTYLFPPAIITSQPVNTTVAQGDNATFNVVAFGTVNPTVTYQWYRAEWLYTLSEKHYLVAGGTNATLVVTNEQPRIECAVGLAWNTNCNCLQPVFTNCFANPFRYYCAVSGSYGSVTSAVVVLNVIVPPNLTSQPQSLTRLQGQTAVFSVGAETTVAGQTPLTYQWFFNGAALPGATSTNLTLANVTSAEAGSYYARVTGGIASTQSVTANLTVIAPNLGIASPADNVSLNTTRVNVMGTFTNIVTGIPIKRISVNGIPAFLNGGTFDALNVPLAVGANSIVAAMEDIAGNTNSATMTITGTAPQVDPVQLTATLVGGFAPLNVGLEVSVDVLGTLQSVLYDFNGDDLADQTNADLNPITNNYAAAGENFPVATIVTSAGRFSSLGGWNSYDANRLRVNVQLPPVALATNYITDPVDLKVATNGHLYVLSRSSATITELNTNGTVVRSLAGIGSTPQGLDVDNLGNVYVAVSGNHQVWKFTATANSFAADASFGNGGYIGETNGTAGTNSGQFNAPYDVAVSPDGTEICVSDTGNHRIQKFSAPSGAFVTTFGTYGTNLGQFSAPKGLTYDRVGNLYIADSGNNRVALAESADSVSGTSGTAGTGLGQFSGAANLGVSSRGIYVADAGNNRVQRFDPIPTGHGDAPTPFTRRVALGSELGLSQPSAAMAVEHFLEEHLYIADTGNNRVLLVKLPLDNPEPSWNAMVTNLQSGNIEAAISYYSSIARDYYRQAFISIGSTELLPAINQIGALTPDYIGSDEAEYFFTNTIDGQTITFPVEFIKENGEWKIDSF